MKTASMPLVFALLLIAVQLLITAAEDGKTNFTPRHVQFTGSCMNRKLLA